MPFWGAHTPRLAAILRLDMPAADSLSTSRILRMGNLGPGLPRSLWKRSEAMPIRGDLSDKRGYHAGIGFMSGCGT